MEPAPFAAPAPKPNLSVGKSKLPCPFSPQGMLQPSHVQPPPMFGPRGATIPPRHLKPYTPKPGNHFAPDAREGYRGRGGGRGGARPRFQPRNNNQFGQRSRFQQNNNNNHSGDNEAGASHSFREFWCESCDREFHSAEQLSEHRAQHRGCPFDGCPFVANEAMVNQHVQQQHSTGLYEQIKNLNTPEDIEKWREERRKRYPTKQNIELRQQIQMAKQKRGERINEPNNRFGQKSDRRTGAPGGAYESEKPKAEKQMGPEAKKKNRKKRKQKPVVEVQSAEKEKPEINGDEDQTNNGLAMFKGTMNMKNYKRPKVLEVNALSGMLGDYGSDDESISDTEEEEEADDYFEADIPDIAVTPELLSKEPVTPENIVQLPSPTWTSNDPIEEAHTFEEALVPTVEEIDDPDNGPPEEENVKRVSDLPIDDKSTNKIDVPPTPKRQRPEENEHQPKRKVKRPTLDMSKRYRNQNTMLEKLLQKDIRHERNILLQCVRYIVEKQFFGIGQPKKSDEV